MSPPARIGPYRVLGVLGRGGMGVVYAVQRDGIERPLALKLLHAQHANGELLERFSREARLLTRIQHPNVLRIHDVGRAGHSPYLVTDQVEGGDLGALARRAPLAPRQAAELLNQLTGALGALHAQGILHRDLKPENVLLTPEGHVVLLDFGLARELDAQTLTRTGAVLGTPSYMAPEQVRGLPSRDLDGRTDVYGLGAILFTLLTGRAPFKGKNMVAVLERVLTSDPRWPSQDRADVPRDLEAICKLAMRRDREQRYPTVQELGDDLARYLAGAPVNATALIEQLPSTQSTPAFAEHTSHLDCPSTPGLDATRVSDSSPPSGLDVTRAPGGALDSGRLSTQADLPHEQVTLASGGVHAVAVPALGELAQGEPQRIGKYQLRGEIARGGMGVVYRVFDPGLGVERALKLLLTRSYKSANSVERFLREAQSLAKLRHPNIIQVHDQGFHGSYPYFVQPYLKGGSLADLLKRGGRLELERALDLVELLARGLQVAHEQGIVHRDLKPANILLDEGGTPYLSDFGIARDLNARESLTRTGQIVGTLTYMAPEQARGAKSQIGPATDVYALGVLLYQLLTGRLPLTGEGQVQLLAAIVYEEPTPLERLRPELPAGLGAIVRRAMAKRPDQRHDCAAELADDLRRVREGDTAPATGFPWKLWCLVWVSVASLLLVGFLPLFWEDKEEQQTAPQAPLEVEAPSPAAPNSQGAAPDDQAAKVPTHSYRQLSSSHALALAKRAASLEEGRQLAVTFWELAEWVRTHPEHTEADDVRATLRALRQRRLWSFQDPDVLPSSGFEAYGAFLDPLRMLISSNQYEACGKVHMLDLLADGEVVTTWKANYREGLGRVVRAWALHRDAQGVARDLFFASDSTQVHWIDTQTSQPPQLTPPADPMGAMWEVPTRGPFAGTPIGPHKDLYALAISPQRDVLAVGGAWEEVWLLGLPGREVLGVLGPHASPVKSLVFSPDGKLLLSAAGYSHLPWQEAENQVRVFDIQTQALVRALSREDIRGTPNVLALAPDGSRVAIGTQAARIFLYDYREDELQLSQISQQFGLPAHPPECAIAGLVYQPGGRVLYSASAVTANSEAITYVRAWDMSSPAATLIWQLELSPRENTSLHMSPRGHWLLLGCGGRYTLDQGGLVELYGAGDY